MTATCTTTCESELDCILLLFFAIKAINETIGKTEWDLWIRLNYYINVIISFLVLTGILQLQSRVLLFPESKD